MKTIIYLLMHNKKTNAVKANPQKYRTIMKVTPFDYLDLPETLFSATEIKELYRLRWGIETSFRELKYAIGMTHFHAKKVEYILREIWSRLVLYNFCEVITAKVAVKKNHKRKHIYQLNYTRAIHICCHFLTVRNEKAPPDVEYLIEHELLPVRPGRSDPRKVKPQLTISFLYRVA